MNVAWLFTGPEIGLKKNEVQDLKAQISKKFGQIEDHILYAYESNVFDLLSILQSISLFSAPIFVEYRNAELIKNKAEVQAIQNWIKNASVDDLSFLVLESEDISIDKKIESAFSASQKKIFWEMFENKKQEWVRNFFRNNGLNITDEAIGTILQLVENNTEALKNECQHLVLFFEKNTRIEKSEIERLLSHNKTEDVFSLFDALTQNDFEKTFDILNKLLLSKNFSAVQFIIGLTYCFRKLSSVHKFLSVANEKPNQNNLKRFGIISKKAMNQNIRALQLWNGADVDKIILLLNNCDLNIRKTSESLQNILLEVTILKIARKQLDSVKL